MLRCRVVSSRVNGQLRYFSTNHLKFAGDSPVKGESERMKQFHEKLKLENLPKGASGMRFVDLVLVKTNPETGELIPDSEKDPTKYGDWQHNGRVSDF